MNGPVFESFRPSRPVPQRWQVRVSSPFLPRGKRCGPSNSSSLSNTSVVRNSFVPAIAAENSRQNWRMTSFHSISLLEMRSS